MYGYHLSVCLQTGLFVSDGYVFYVICFYVIMYGYHLSVSMSTRTGLFSSDGYAFHVIYVSRIRIGLYMVISHQFVFIRHFLLTPHTNI